MQLVFALGGQFLLKIEDQPWQPYRAALIKPGHIHQMNSLGEMQIFIYLDAESQLAQQLDEQYLQQKPINSLTNSPTSGPTIGLEYPYGSLRNYFMTHVMPDMQPAQVTQFCSFILKTLVQPFQISSLDPRIEQALILIEQNADLAVGEIASNVCLSESRLRHLFKDQVGQSVKSYQLWAKVLHSLGGVLRGEKLADVCVAAGFYDGAHMSKSYQTLLGTSPSKLKQLKDAGLEIVAGTDSPIFRMNTRIFHSKNHQDIAIKTPNS